MSDIETSPEVATSQDTIPVQSANTTQDVAAAHDATAEQDAATTTKDAATDQTDQAASPEQEKEKKKKKRGGSRKKAGNRGLVETYGIAERGFASHGGRMHQVSSLIGMRIPQLVNSSNDSSPKHNLICEFLKDRHGSVQSFLRDLLFTYLGSEIGKADFRSYLEVTKKYSTDTVETYMNAIGNAARVPKVDFIIARKKGTLKSS